MAEAICKPEIGEWYKDLQHRQFEVVAIDDDTIEIQYLDGDVEEIDFETWELLCMTPSAAPHDGVGPFDDLVDENEGYQLNEELKPISWDNMYDEY